jgi:hypothetical protein
MIFFPDVRRLTHDRADDRTNRDCEQKDENFLTITALAKAKRFHTDTADTELAHRTLV